MDRARLQRVVTALLAVVLVLALFGVLGPWHWHPGALGAPTVLLIVLVLLLVL